MGGLCDYCVITVPIGLGFLFGTALGLGLCLMGLDLGLGLDNYSHTVGAYKYFYKSCYSCSVVYFGRKYKQIKPCPDLNSSFHQCLDLKFE